MCKRIIAGSVGVGVTRRRRTRFVSSRCSSLRRVAASTCGCTDMMEKMAINMPGRFAQKRNELLRGPNPGLTNT